MVTPAQRYNSTADNSNFYSLSTQNCLYLPEQRLTNNENYSRSKSFRVRSLCSRLPVLTVLAGSNISTSAS